MSTRIRRIQQWQVVPLASPCVALGACTSPVRDVLIERRFLDDIEERPEVALADLHRVMIAEKGDPDLLFARAELSFLHGDASETPFVPTAAGSND